MKLYIVVPTFERFGHINNLIATLEGQTFKNYVLVVVDHGVSKVEKVDNKKLVYLNASSKLWWTGAINVGVNYVLKNFEGINTPILIINDDVSIAKNDYLEGMFEYWSKNQNSLVGSICATRSNEIIYCNMIYNFSKAKLLYENKGSNILDLDTNLFYSDVLKGRGTLIASSVFKKIGLFNEKFLPHYKADHEFSYRAKKKGFSLVVLKKALVYSDLDSPNKFDKKRKLYSVLKILFGIRSTNNLKDLFYYSFLCFTPFYAVYYFVINSLKIILSNLKKTFFLG
ncbi:glycosyltransferase [uncultured Polaribacter sp.]|uniref:glycosyltransferase family 2 protein n=1 Tax=uncultured Polaribacter sp. TaxID=174711 RepID=UPI00262B265A|nr:glycosyltransferase [uncultured Polaribacter sp.]